jgi:chromosomal replication initiation ATPase DnaA
MKLPLQETWRVRPVGTAIAVVSSELKVRRSDLRNNGSRARCHVRPRQLAMWLACELGGSTPHVGRYMGYDHSTVVHARHVVDRRRLVDPAYAALCTSLVQRAAEYRWDNPAISAAGTPDASICAQPAE